MIDQLKRRSFLTEASVLVMVIIFILMTFAGGSTNSQVLIDFGAENNTLINAGQWWRLLSASFIHIGYQHLILNLIFIYFLGKIVENNFGHWRFMFIFLISGIAGNLFSFAFDTGLSAGSSTVIFGLFGAYFSLYFAYPNNMEIRQQSSSFVILILFNLLFDIFMPSISLVGHLGGLVGGFLISQVLGVPNEKTLNKKSKIIYANALIIVIIVMYYIGLNR